jgi:hypothetical protein
MGIQRERRAEQPLDHGGPARLGALAAEREQRRHLVPAEPDRTRAEIAGRGRVEARDLDPDPTGTVHRGGDPVEVEDREVLGPDAERVRQRDPHRLG